MDLHGMDDGGSENDGSHMKRIACIGECMLELVSTGEAGRYMLGYAGDTYNTAVYCKRQLGKKGDVAYFTALGEGPLTTGMLHRFMDEGLETGHIRTIADRNPGLYLIENDVQGDRRFYYWRSESAARKMFVNDTVESLAEELSGFDLVYFSGITLAILDAGQRLTLYSALLRLAAETIIAFDPNYRRTLWESEEQAQKEFTKAASVVTIVLSGTDDEIGLRGKDRAADFHRFWLSKGVDEIVLKDGVNGCFLYTGKGQHRVPLSKRMRAIDTTGAGDAFNAGYLCGRLFGHSPEASAAAGHALAGQVVLHRGAILPRIAC